MTMYYVYQLIDSRNNQPFYIGKGSGNRKDTHVDKVRRGQVSENRYKDKVIRDIYQDTGEWPVSEIIEWFSDENSAYDYETVLIENYGTYQTGGILTNIMTENKPPCHKGRKRSEETRKKLADRCGKKNPMWGRTQTEKTKSLWANRKNPWQGKYGDDHPLNGFVHSDEECQRRSGRMKDQWKDEKYAEKIVKNLDRSKQWEITSPDGEQHIVTNLKQFTDGIGVPYHRVRRGLGGWKCIEMK